MPSRVVVVEVHEYPGHMKPGLKVGNTQEYNPNTREANLIKMYAAFVPDANLAAMYTDINTAVDSNATATT